MARTAEIETEDVSLSFAHPTDGPIVCYWSPRRTGCWDVDCRTGRSAAVTLARAIRDTGNPGLLMLALAAIFAAGSTDQGVEVGFMTTIAELTRRGLQS